MILLRLFLEKGARPFLEKGARPFMEKNRASIFGAPDKKTCTHKWIR
jgi:hypothetical protein